MKANKKQPEVQFSERFVVHLSGHFRKPVIERGENSEEDSADYHVVKVSHNVIGVPELPIERRHSERYSSQSRNKKLEQKRDTEQHWRRVSNLSSPHGRQPIKKFDARRD